MTHDGTREAVEALFDKADVKVGGDRPWDIRIHDDRFYNRVLSEGSLALGESYVEGWWDAGSVDELICHILHSNLQNIVRGNWKYVCHILQARLLNLQNSKRAFEVGERHYDIGNDLYEPMLGPSMAYTCAYWRNAGSLDEAQHAKYDLVCRKVGLQSGMQVLELGCGWSGFARYAAEQYGARVTGYTVSKEQAAWGRENCRGLPVEIRMEDYRHATGAYDAVVSIGIMEHVGYKNYRTYMELAESCLKPGGLAFIHTSGGNSSNVTIEPWIHRNIFPNAMLPSITQIGEAMEGLFVMEDWHNIGPDYDRTLMAWGENFERAWPGLKDKYGERFYRMWRYYLLACAGSFRSRYNQLWQVVMTRVRDGRPQPDCRLV